MKIILRSARETKMFAARLAKAVFRGKRGKRALVFGLVGELGAGKTTFIQSFIKTFRVKQRAVSPSFLIFRIYRIPKPPKSGYRRIYHVDCYRLRKARELYFLGFREIIKNAENIVIIEWADRIRRRLPKGVKWLILEHGQKPNERKLTTTNDL